MEFRAGNAVELLVDDEMGRAVTAAIQGARRSIELSQLLFFPDYVARFERRGLFRGSHPERPLIEELKEAGARGAKVRVLLNHNTVLPDTVRQLAQECDEAPNVEVRGLPLALNLFHAKVLVVDDEEAILVGPPFEQRFWDTRRHDLLEPRRGAEQPIHDLSLRIRGPAVADVRRFFDGLWREPVPAPPAVPPAAGRQSLALARTLPRGPYSPEGDRSILRAYLDAIERAERFVYLENQYFTNPTMTRALKDALAREPSLQVILVVNEHMDIPGYDTWQEARARDLGYPDHPRLGMFSLASPRRSGGELRPMYIHTKLGIVDDTWMTLGSANLDSISLEEADEFAVPTEPNIELNAILPDGIDGHPETGFVGAARRRVWAEHLGDRGVWRADPPPGGWLELWRRCAEENLERAQEGRPTRGFVVPYAAKGALREKPRER